MSNGTKRLGKEFQGPPQLHSVTVTYDGKGIVVNFKNANWELAVSLLVDGLQIARNEETKIRQKQQESRIVVPSLAGVPPLRES